MTTPVWIDCDMGFDDLAAVLVVAASPAWRIEGLSLVAGNAPLDVVRDNAERAAAFFDWRFPIHAGADRPLSGTLVTAQHVLGPDAMRSAGASLPRERRTASPESAIEALARWLDTTPQAHMLALGPLTNIARLIESHASSARRIARLVWMGGSAGPGNHTAAAEFNAFADPEAAQAVLDFGLPLAMVGLDACRQLRVRKTDAERLRSAGSAPGRVLGDLLEAYVRIADPQGAKPMAFYDPTAAVALVEPGAVDFRRGRLDIELEGRHTRGMTVIEWRVPRRAEANAEVATTVDEDRARAIVLAALGDAARGH